MISRRRSTSSSSSPSSYKPKKKTKEKKKKKKHKKEKKKKKEKNDDRSKVKGPILGEATPSPEDSQDSKQVLVDAAKKAAGDTRFCCHSFAV